MTESAERAARNALNRLNRAVEKGLRELGAVEGALRHAEGRDFPAEAFDAARRQLEGVVAFVEEQSDRLEEKLLQAGGLEPGRVRRSGGLA